MRTKRTILFILILLVSGVLFEGLSFAQNSAWPRTITGTIKDASGLPIPGAAILPVGENGGTATDVAGNFSLRMNAPGDLTVSCLGYATQTVTVGPNQVSVTIVLDEDTTVLDETVVVGYGTQKKVNLTGAVTAVEGKELENRSAHNLSVMLQGAVPGLIVTTSSGVPGSTGGTLNVRGYTSINGADPLVLIDGTIGDLDRVNPNDVASISVIKDAAAAAVYGARAAFGVILVTTKSGSDNHGKATVRYTGRMGWQGNTTSTDFETVGYNAVLALNTCRVSGYKAKYVLYGDDEMEELYIRRNDKVEDPSRPWCVTKVIDGKERWRYYGNHDSWHERFNDTRPLENHNLSVTGGNQSIHYFVSAGYEKEVGITKANPDVFRKYNIRSKIDFDVNKWIRLSNNTSFYNGIYNYIGLGEDPQDCIAYSAAHANPIWPLKNPDGSWIYMNEGILNGSYGIGNGRHIVLAMGKHRNREANSDFQNTSEVTLKPFKNFTLIGNYTYRLHRYDAQHRWVKIPYREYPGTEMQYYTTGEGADRFVDEAIKNIYQSANVYGTYDATFGGHHLTAMLGGNWETRYYKRLRTEAENLLSEELDDMALVGTAATGETVDTVLGGQSEYALLGFFGRINYDYLGRYLLEISGRYDGTSRFAKGHRWGLFPSVSVGWRISEEPFFQPVKGTINNLKLRASFGTLGNQNVDDYLYVRTIGLETFKNYNFDQSSTQGAKYATISSPNSSELTWERSEQYNLGFDVAAINNRLEMTAEAYIRDTKNMLTEGYALPSIYGADAPQQNTADLRTKGFEFSIGWRDQVMLGGRPLGYSIRGSVNKYNSVITKYDNEDKTFAKDYYEGMELGEIWGFVVDGLFQSNEEAQAYAKEVNLSYVAGKVPNGLWAGGDPKYLDLDGDGKIGIGSNNVSDPGDRIIIGNNLPRLSYGFNFGLDYAGFDLSVFFQGVGNRHRYLPHQAWNFWGVLSNTMQSYIQKDFLSLCWSEDNKDAYWPRPVGGYATSGAPLNRVNTRYLLNARYLRLKNLTIGYTIPQRLTGKIGLEKVRAYFTGENLQYWSPIKKVAPFVDPEGVMISRSSYLNRAFHPWPKTFLFGFDIVF